MAINAAQVLVSSTAVALNGPETDTVSGGRIIVKNTHGTDALILGPSNVAVGTGFALAAGATIELVLGSGEQVYALRSSTNDITAHVLRVG